MAPLLRLKTAQTMGESVCVRLPWVYGSLILEPAITPMAELDAKRGTKPASAEDFERLTADDAPADGEG